ncbi:restriction endonuclease subunit S [bacterium]|jgi:type I restriction enzyme, S subunit|nr:restriction endonuclease subunit S [bacterium]
MVVKRSEQSELEIIPKDWKFKKIKNIGNVIRGASPRPKGDKRFYGGDVPRLMVQDVTRDGKFVTPRVDFLTKEGEKRSRPCKKGTLTIVCSGTVGIPSFLAVDACIHDGFLAITNLNENISEDYLYHQLSNLRNKFETSATHGGVFTNLTTSILKEFEVAFPPTKDEQLQIVKILSNIDELINNLKKLIEKKKNIKEGAMQELLTGKRRLDGFQKEWQFVQLKKIIDLKSGYSFKSENFVPTSNKIVITPGNFPKEGGLYFNIKNSTFYDGTIPDGFVLNNGDLLIVMTDLTRDGDILGNSGILNSDYTILHNQRIAKVLFKQKINKEFLNFVLNSKSYKQQILKTSSGTGVIHTSPTRILECNIPLPMIDEQSEIAKILYDMDLDIHDLENHLNKYNNLKQGIMQKLLMGGIRLK